MKKKRRVRIEDLNNGDTFRFDKDNNLYEVFDEIFYRKFKSKGIGKMMPCFIYVNNWIDY